ncbi:MAG TPA: hypothetical protein VFM31_07290 [Nitrososphaeraceae archaeon]|nr:hypothetical protein [Nitrososphaeraceae archaeon]
MKTILTINKTNQKYFDHQHHTGIYCKCPDCNGDIVYGLVSCPDDKEGCCVAHWNYGCQHCKTVFNIIFEKDEYDNIPSNSMKFSSEIGVAVINPRAISKLKI